MATLGEFQDRAFLLNLLLFVLSVPMIVVVLYYIATSVGLIIDRQRNEIALLKSRGASTIQIIAIYLTEGVIMGAFALIIGPIIGLGVAELIGDSYGFLLFAQRPPLPLWVDSETIQYAVGAVVISVLASLIPAVGAARHSIVSYKQQIARSSSAPMWQRFFVDFLLLAVSGYGYRLLSQNQSIITIGQTDRWRATTEAVHRSADPARAERGDLWGRSAIPADFPLVVERHLPFSQSGRRCVDRPGPSANQPNAAKL